MDSHIFQVWNRTKLAVDKNVDQVEQKHLKVVPQEFNVDVHRWPILHGRDTYIPRKPCCGSYIIEDFCEFKDKTD